jgi:hypothetical protein
MQRDLSHARVKTVVLHLRELTHASFQISNVKDESHAYIVKHTQPGYIKLLLSFQHFAYIQESDA